ncbi:MAG TPA: VOC family protein [Candidatus Eisenbacteria bacterium]|nr:VOC family protein [Candidatus Eisenbacteria bacterium]
MAKARNPIPEGQHSVSPQLTVKNAAQALEFYKRAFGAKETSRFPGPNGMIMHASMTIGDSCFFLNDEIPAPGGTKSPSVLGGTPVVLNLYVTDCDKIYNQAIAAGAKASMPLADQFWGDRYGQVTDPFGHIWAIATRKEDLSTEELQERGKQFMSSMAQR